MMMRPALIVILAAGCGGSIASEYVPLGPPVATRRADTVDVFMSGRPPRALVDIGVIELHESDILLIGSSRLGTLIGMLRTEGAAHGCDAVIANPPTMERSRWMITATCSTYLDTRTQAAAR